MERRSFLRLAGLAGLAGMAGVGAAAAAGCTPGDGAGEASRTAHVLDGGPVKFSHNCDVLVVGSGLAGLSAAIEPLRAGRKTILVEKSDLLGGCSFKSSGVFYVAGSKVQTQKGFAKDVEAAWNSFAADMKAKKHVEPDSVVKRTFFESGRWVDVLVDEFGAQFGDPSTYLEPGDVRSILLGAKGVADLEPVMTPLKNGLADKGLTTMTSLDARRVILDRHDQVAGVRAIDIKSQTIIDISARVVVLAMGGFGDNQDIVEYYSPDRSNLGVHYSYDMGDFFPMTDGLKVKTGAVSTVMDCTSDVLSADTWGMFAPMVAVTPKGERFAAEDDPTAAPNRCANDELGFWWTIFDKTLPAGVLSAQVGKMTQKYAKRFFGPFDKLEDLAHALGIPNDALAKTFEDHDRAIDEHRDDPMGKKRMRRKLAAPFFALKLIPMRKESYGGLAVDDNFRVQNESNAAIPHLYAAGGSSSASFQGLVSAGTTGWLAGKAASDELG